MESLQLSKRRRESVTAPIFIIDVKFVSLLSQEKIYVTAQIGFHRC